MFGLFVVALIALIVGVIAARLVLSSRWRHRWAILIGALFVSSFSTMGACFLGAISLFLGDWLELPNADEYFWALIFNGWVVGSWTAVFVLPLVVLTTLLQGSAKYLPEPD